MPRSIILLVIANQRKDKYRLHAATTLLFYILQEEILKKVADVTNIC
jgi:hypothetical protein